MVAALSLLAALWAPPELKAYLDRPYPEFSVELGPRTMLRQDLNLVSQKWQGFTWKHQVSVHTPEEVAYDDAMILYITGDNVEDKDAPFIREFSQKAKLPVAALFDVPNQPIFEAKEDALIAITLGKFLETKDSTWPLLFPMTRSAIAAMDAIQQHNPKIKRFMVCGASKRGWTTWLVGASGDKRVVGIAPMVFDMLDFKAQLQHQKSMWGDYSPEIRDYVSTGLTEIAETPDGARLIRMVDPASYLSDFKLPTLIVVGGNDAYWAVDAHNLYWDRIQTPHKLMRVVPNAGHNLNGGKEAAASVGAFAHLCLGGGWPLKQGLGPEWRAYSTTKNFRESVWSKTAKAAPGDKFVATFHEQETQVGGVKASFTSVVQVKAL